jgi:hypothetical protein
MNSNNNNNNSPKPLATASRVDLPLTEATPMPPRRTTTNFNPVYLAMLSANTMRDCNQVQAMMMQCAQSFNSKDGMDQPFVCHTAEKYFQKCSEGQA